MRRRVKTRTRVCHVGDFFPPEEELSPVVAALLVRVDEGRLAYERVRLARDEPLTSDTLNWIFLCTRMLTISIDDAASLVKKLTESTRFTAALDAVPWRRRIFDEAQETLAHSARDWHHVRDRVAGHVSVDHLRRALKHEAHRLKGEVTIGDDAADRRWPVLHALVVVMLHSKEGRGLTLEAIAPILDNVHKALGALLAIEGPIIAAYDSITGGSLLTVK